MRIYPTEIIAGCFFNSFLVGGCIGLIYLLQPLARQLPLPGYIASPLVGILSLWGGVLVMMTVVNLLGGTPIREFLRLFFGFQVFTAIILLAGLSAVGTHYALINRVTDTATLEWSVGGVGMLVFWVLVALCGWYCDRLIKRRKSG
jgi:xanthosine utilization system XapX-like protein